MREAWSTFQTPWVGHAEIGIDSIFDVSAAAAAAVVFREITCQVFKASPESLNKTQFVHLN